MKVLYVLVLCFFLFNIVALCTEKRTMQSKEDTPVLPRTGITSSNITDDIKDTNIVIEESLNEQNLLLPSERKCHNSYNTSDIVNENSQRVLPSTYIPTLQFFGDYNNPYEIISGYTSRRNCCREACHNCCCRIYEAHHSIGNAFMSNCSPLKIMCVGILLMFMYIFLLGLGFIFDRYILSFKEYNN